MKNIFWFTHINSIGGVESFYWYLAQKYQDRDITIYYKTGDEAQISRLRQFVEVRKHKGELITCEKAFFNYNTDIINYVKAKEYIQILHAVTPFPIHPKITKVLGVSNAVCDAYRKRTGKDIELAYNPIVVQKPKKVLHLLSATRLSHEKGKARMETLAKILDANDVAYTWEVFTNDKTGINNKNVIFRKPELSIIDHIASADWLIQLSDDEAYCYSVVEALCVGTPVIVTDCKVFHEIGVEHGKNGIVLKHDFKTVPVSLIRKGLKFKYDPLPDRWDAILADGESEYKKKFGIMVDLHIIRPYFDLQLKRQVQKGEVITVNMVRADELIEFGVGGEVSGLV